jgi:dihydroorotase (multifunctional complex type)
MPSILIESASMLADHDDTLSKVNILIENSQIRRISKTNTFPAADTVIHADGLVALPGLIDAHVHLRDLQLSYKETFETGTRAAAVGGFTTVLDMPNTQPPTTSSVSLGEKMSRAEGRLFSNVAFQGSLLTDPAELKRMAEQGAVAFKLYLNKALETFDSSDQAKLTIALQAAKKADVPVTVHGEEGDEIRRIQSDCMAHRKTSLGHLLSAHTASIEVTAVRRILGLAAKIGLRLHICHITIPEAVKLVKRTPNATCEATAHHLLLNQSAFRKYGTLAMCVPPIRRERERLELWNLFARGEVDILASDHAPHTLEEKTKQNAWEAASGVPGLETSLPVMFTQVSNGKLTLRRLVEATSSIPARIFHLSKKGQLKEGFDADIVLVDPKEKTRVDPAGFLSKAKYSPFAGLRCVGRAAYTIVNGTLVTERGKIVGPPAGRVTRSIEPCASS